MIGAQIAQHELQNTLPVAIAQMPNNNFSTELGHA